jgi:hypothetical protein
MSNPYYEQRKPKFLYLDYTQIQELLNTGMPLEHILYLDVSTRIHLKKMYPNEYVRPCESEYIFAEQYAEKYIPPVESTLEAIEIPIAIPAITLE